MSYTNIYVRDYEGVWYYELGDVMENQYTGERYLIVEESLAEMLNGGI